MRPSLGRRVDERGLAAVAVAAAIVVGVEVGVGVGAVVVVRAVQRVEVPAYCHASY